MVDQSEDDDCNMAIGMSKQNSQPEAKRSKPREVPIMSPEESRRLQREMMAVAAEKRMQATKIASPPPASASSPIKVEKNGGVLRKEKEAKGKEGNSGGGLSEEEAEQLFSMLFGNYVSLDVLAQWTNQGIRFSPDPETSMGLVQHEGGPCGVLATIQAFVLKYLLFFSGEIGKSNVPQNLGFRRYSKNHYVASENFASFPEDAKARALVKSMAEILFSCGGNKRAVIANLGPICNNIQGSEGTSTDMAITQALEGLWIESATDLHKVLRVETHEAQSTAFKRLYEMLPVFQSRIGALLFLISALLSRGLDEVQADRDDPTLPLVTAPFGHASQETVNLLLCGRAVANVFDGRMDLGGDMFLKGIPKDVEIGFLTLLESLNYCKVGQHLKRPKWPIWVVGSESHYTVLFALDTTVQDENELELRESRIRKAFDAKDMSGGGGFISVEGFKQVLRETNTRLSHENLESLTSAGFIVWSEFWQVILGLDRSSGGLSDDSELMGSKVFDLYHFNGIAKSVMNGSQSTSAAGVVPTQRPRLTKLRVSVPPRWIPEEFIATSKPESSQRAPLVDCVRTRWPRSLCNWEGDPPSIV